MKPLASHQFSPIRSGIVLLVLGMVPALVLGQDQPTPISEVTITSTPAKTSKVSDLAARYRFSERYSADDTRTAPGLVASYRIAIVDVSKESIETPQGAPKRSESTRHSIFTERPAEMNGLNNVMAVTRTYERFKVKPLNLMETGNQPLEGLSILLRTRLADLPEILSLTEGRSLTEYEYDAASHQMFIPQVSLLVPIQVIRIGDTWKVTRRAAQALLGDPFIVGDGLIGKLVEIRKEVDGPRSVAAIEITGKLPTSAGESTINAELLFTFIGESSLKGFEKNNALLRPKDDITEGRGSITEIRLARATSGPLPGNTRLRYQSNREVTMHRQIGLVEGAPKPEILKMIPDPTETNTWLTHFDAAYRYSLRHPQNLLYPERSLANAEPRTSFMIRNGRDGRDMLQIEFVPRILTPEELKKELNEKYKAVEQSEKNKSIKMDVIRGNEVWLPEAEWPKMKVHRVDAEVKMADLRLNPTAGSPRLHFDGYLIQTGQGSSIIAIASTTKDAVSSYRTEIEKILKTIKLDPPRPSMD